MNYNIIIPAGVVLFIIGLTTYYNFGSVLTNRGMVKHNVKMAGRYIEDKNTGFEGKVVDYVKLGHNKYKFRINIAKLQAIPQIEIVYNNPSIPLNQCIVNSASIMAGEDVKMIFEKFDKREIDADESVQRDIIDKREMDVDRKIDDICEKITSISRSKQHDRRPINAQ